MEPVKNVAQLSIGKETKKHVEKNRQRLKKVLIVDDDLDFADLLMHKLVQQEPQIKCIKISDPYEAVISLTDQSFDKIYMDQNMPGLNGNVVIREADRFIDYDTTSQMMRSPTQKTPVVLMSGSDLDKLDPKFSFFEIAEKINKRELAVFS